MLLELYFYHLSFYVIFFLSIFISSVYFFNFLYPKFVKLLYTVVHKESSFQVDFVGQTNHNMKEAFFLFFSYNNFTLYYNNLNNIIKGASHGNRWFRIKMYST